MLLRPLWLDRLSVEHLGGMQFVLGETCQRCSVIAGATVVNTQATVLFGASDCVWAAAISVRQQHVGVMLNTSPDRILQD